jgi:hypothetical protein
MDLSLAVVADAIILRFVPARRRVARFVLMSIFFAVHTVLIVALVGSPLHPVYKPKARSQFITQLYKRARPVVDRRNSAGGEIASDSLGSRPIFPCVPSGRTRHCA